jgi:hypothetical protein
MEFSFSFFLVMGQTGFVSRQNTVPKIARNCLLVVKKAEEMLVDLEAGTVVQPAGVLFQ